MTGYTTDQAWSRSCRHHHSAAELAEMGEAGMRTTEAAMRYLALASAPAAVSAASAATSPASRREEAPSKPVLTKRTELRIVLATDGSAAADCACELAANLDWPVGTTIELVTAYDPATPATVLTGLGDFPDTIDAIAEAIRKDAQFIVDSAARRLERPGLCVEARVAEGRAADVILQSAASLGANLVIVGHRGLGPFESAMLGSVSAEVIERAACPVLVARTVGMGRILVADDGSEPVERRDELIHTLSSLYRGSVVVVSVAERDPHWPGWTRTLEPHHLGRAADVASADRAAHEQIARTTAERLWAAGLDATYSVIEGQPARCLVDAAVSERADLIVIGAPTLAARRTQVSGKIARAVLAHAPCSVLVIPESEAPHP